MSQRLILDEGYGNLQPWSSQEAHIYARKSLNRARILFFYKKPAVDDANLGLSKYYLIKNDTFNCIKKLNKVIGNSNCEKIENSQFSKLKKTQSGNSAIYNATKLRIQIALSQNEMTIAANYLTYLKEYVETTWYCGLGLWGHQTFVEEVEAKIKEEKIKNKL